jgi:hypothetical protein
LSLLNACGFTCELKIVVASTASNSHASSDGGRENMCSSKSQMLWVVASALEYRANSGGMLV